MTVKNEYLNTIIEWAGQSVIKENFGELGVKVVGDRVIEISLSENGETSIVATATESENQPNTFKVSSKFNNMVNAISGRLKRAGAAVVTDEPSGAPKEVLKTESVKSDAAALSKTVNEAAARPAPTTKVEVPEKRPRGRPSKPKPETQTTDQPAPKMPPVDSIRPQFDSEGKEIVKKIPTDAELEAIEKEATKVSPIVPPKDAPKTQEEVKSALVENPQPKIEKPKSKVLESFKPKAETSKEMILRPAKREIARARVGFAGASGSGKTASALLFAYGLCADWSRIAIIDTEHGSGDLYVGETIPKNGGVTIGEYSVIPIEAPYTPDKFTGAIKIIEDAKDEKGGHAFDVIIIDSLSHGWIGDGALLDIQGKEADRLGNSWAAWRKVTPMHSKLIESILKSPLHIIVTARSKQAHVQEKNSETGKSVVKRVGMETQFRDGIEYELTTFFDLAQDHTAFCSKDRTNIFDGSYSVVTPEQGQKMGRWLTGKTKV